MILRLTERWWCKREPSLWLLYVLLSNLSLIYYKRNYTTGMTMTKSGTTYNDDDNDEVLGVS